MALHPYVCADRRPAHRRRPDHRSRGGRGSGRLGTLPDIAGQFELLRAEEERTITAKVESALPVSESHQKRISEALERKLGRRVELEVTMDATLIGGAVIRAGDLVIDGSVRARLEKLAAAISS